MQISIAGALREARGRLAAAADSPALDAQTLLAALLGVDRAYLLAHPEQALTAAQADAYEAWVARCTAGEPLPYVLGRWAWYDRSFEVSPAVLIPRPETELLLESALDWSAGRAAGVAVDIGTGSGALAVTFAAHRPSWHLLAVDASPAALDVARRNAAHHDVAERVTFYEGDLLAPLPVGTQLDLLMANLPYIPTDELPNLRVSQHEPLSALDGGADGLALIRRLLATAPPLLASDALVLLEIGAGQGEAVAGLARAALPTAQVNVLRDYAGLERIVRVRADNLTKI
jgi:release factor glutamine methyltransferase